MCSPEARSPTVPNDFCRRIPRSPITFPSLKLERYGQVCPLILSPGSPFLMKAAGRAGAEFTDRVPHKPPITGGHGIVWRQQHIFLKLRNWQFKPMTETRCSTFPGECDICMAPHFSSHSITAMPNGRPAISMFLVHYNIYSRQIEVKLRHKSTTT